MLTRGLRLLRFLGADVYVAPCSVLAAAVATVVLGAGLIPSAHPELGPLATWLIALLVGFGFFGSVVVHELAHVAVARRHGWHVGVVQLWLLGGTSEVVDSPDRPAQQLAVSLAGPVASGAVAGVFFAASAAMLAFGAPAPGALLAALGWTNLLITTVNLIPVHPLDGGRALEAGLRLGGADGPQAARWVAAVGQALGGSIIAGGAITLLAGQPLPGIWLVFTGIGMRSVARPDAPRGEASERALPSAASPPPS